MLDFDIIAGDEEMGRMAKEYAKLRLKKKEEDIDCNNENEVRQESIYSESTKKNYIECLERGRYLSLDKEDQSKINKILENNAILIGINDIHDEMRSCPSRENNKFIFLVKLKKIIVELMCSMSEQKQVDKILLSLISLYLILK